MESLSAADCYVQCTFLQRQRLAAKEYLNHRYQGTELHDGVTAAPLTLHANIRIPHANIKLYESSEAVENHLMEVDQVHGPQHLRGILNVEGTPHHLYLDMFKHKQQEDGISIIAIDPLPLGADGFRHLAEPVAENLSNIISHVPNTSGVISILGTQKTPLGCVIHSIGIAEIAAMKSKDMVQLHKQLVEHAVPEGKLRVPDQYEELNEEIFENDYEMQDTAVRFEDAAYTVPPEMYALANSRSTIEHVSRIRPELNLDRYPVQVFDMKEAKSSLFQLHHDYKRTYTTESFLGTVGDSIAYNDLADRYRLKITSEALSAFAEAGKEKQFHDQLSSLLNMSAFA